MRYIAFDVETPNRFNSRMSAIGIAVVVYFVLVLSLELMQIIL